MPALLRIATNLKGRFEPEIASNAPSMWRMFVTSKRISLTRAEQTVRPHISCQGRREGVRRFGGGKSRRGGDGERREQRGGRGGGDRGKEGVGGQ
eukprot:223764-Rhodomonas_salina.1